MLIVQLIPPSLHLSKPLAFCLFGVFKILDNTEQKVVQTKEETLKM
jgi:hypothetical protein